MQKIGRREFAGQTAKLLAVAAMPQLLLPRTARAESTPPLRVAAIGTGGQMTGHLRHLVANGHNLVALCDVDAGQLEKAKAALGEPLAKVRAYRDYRELLAQEKDLEAVVVATPDHWHAPVCTAAIKAGKHVYCEKPLTHSLAESRALRALARGSTVVTQLGNQGSAASSLRRSIELIQAGLLGPVREVHAWHHAHGWPSGVDRPADVDPVPEGLDWDFWLGPAPVRPYKSVVYHPGAWRGWYDFGNGSLGDFVCHSFNLAQRALKLEHPESIEIDGGGEGLGKESFPSRCTVRCRFPAAGGRGPVMLAWHTGAAAAPEEVSSRMTPAFGGTPTIGCLIVGEAGLLSAGLWNNECVLRLKDDPAPRGVLQHPAAAAVPAVLPRVGHHMQEWLDACRGGPKTFSNFEIGGTLTEIGLAGIVALRLGRNIRWDGPNLKVPGVPAADAIIHKPYRAGTDTT
jgi:predicted dehydrogenase